MALFNKMYVIQTRVLFFNCDAESLYSISELISSVLTDIHVKLYVIWLTYNLTWMWANTEDISSEMEFKDSISPLFYTVVCINLFLLSSPILLFVISFCLYGAYVNVNAM